MDWTHVAAFLAPYLPMVGGWLAARFQQWLDARYPPKDDTQVSQLGHAEGRDRLLVNQPHGGVTAIDTIESMLASVPVEHLKAVLEARTK